MSDDRTRGASPPGEAPSSFPALVHVACRHRKQTARDRHFAGRVRLEAPEDETAAAREECGESLMQVPPRWRIGVRALGVVADAIGWGIVTRCPGCGRWNEVLVMGSR